jgi:D-alanyl-D-alanine carboxypeptidase/D-alanyl-D-alanine-endopeptidase (penicillin-binding protein 4)
MVPASTQKIVTALAALHYLGETFRYETHLFREGDDLRVKGLGDPLLISETLRELSRLAADRFPTIRHLVLDDSYFSSPLVIPGVSASLNPYDAPNGALCVNFNTVFFRTANGKLASAEPQTPLLPVVVDRIRRTGLSQGRIVLSRHGNETLLYAGHLLAFFLAEDGMEITGRIRAAASPAPGDQPQLRYSSPYALTEVIGRMLEYSNNFIANQLIITSGAVRFGAPGTLTKGVEALQSYGDDILGLTGAVFAEGSGISRENRLSAGHLMTALNAFSNRYRLMVNKGVEWYKTGHLKGIRTRIGYIETKSGLYRFAVLVNTPGKTTHAIMKDIHRRIAADRNTVSAK